MKQLHSTSSKNNTKRNDITSKDENNDPSTVGKSQQVPKQPIVARISLWTTRPNLAGTKSGHTLSDSGNDSDDDSDDGEELDLELDDNAQLEQRLQSRDRARLLDHVSQ